MICIPDIQGKFPEVQRRIYKKEEEEINKIEFNILLLKTCNLTCNLYSIMFMDSLLCQPEVGDVTF